MIPLQNYNRRDFLKFAVLGGGVVLFTGNFDLAHGKTGDGLKNKFIQVNYDKCTGCRTCETICASYNHKVTVDGKTLPGLGNPYYSNIRVSHFNPDVDVPVVCSICTDAPCIKACPVSSDQKTRALSRNPAAKTIVCDVSLCTACGNCARACSQERSGILFFNAETGVPGRLCTLCDGDPQCIKGCPNDALSFTEKSSGDEFYGKSPETIARKLMLKWYGIDTTGGKG